MKLMTVKEAARILSFSEKTLYQWHWLQKDFPFVKVGKSLRVSEEDLFLFIQRNRSEKGKR